MNFWTPLAKLTFGVYMMHVMMIRLHYNTTEGSHSFHYTDYTGAYIFTANYVLAVGTPPSRQWTDVPAPMAACKQHQHQLLRLPGLALLTAAFMHSTEISSLATVHHHPCMAAPNLIHAVCVCRGGVVWGVDTPSIPAVHP